MRHSIGVMDSGMGGLTVVRGIFALGAPVDIVYVGDNANVPYGNRSLEEIVELSTRMLRQLEARGVEAVAIACNTISATTETLRARTKLPLIDIISLGAEYLAERGEPDVGLFATEFTVKSGMHAAIAKARNPGVRVHGVASATLAALIDTSIDDEPAIRAEISSMLARLGANASARGANPIRTVLLGCTHYPIVADTFKSIAPDIEFIDPARLQAQAVLSLVGESRKEPHAAPAEQGSADDERSIARAEPSSGREVSSEPTLEILTSGSFDAYRAMLSRLGIPKPTRISKLSE